VVRSHTVQPTQRQTYRLHHYYYAALTRGRFGWPRARAGRLGNIVRLPAIAEEDETHIIASPYRTRTVRRHIGEALHPEREPEKTLGHLRRTLGEYNFAGQYQQRPTPLGGGLIKAAWFRAYVPGEEPAKFDRIIQSWDTANKSTELSDYSVCTTWGQNNKRLYLLHVLRKRLEYPDLKRAVCSQAVRFRPTNILIEDKASGTQLIQELVRDGVYGATRYKPEMEKVMRLHSVSNIEDGFVYLPTEADWLADYIHELTTFPGGKHDDQTDSTSQALDWLKQNTYTYGLFEYYRREELAQKLGLPSEYRFTQCDEDDEILAMHNSSGHKITLDQPGMGRCRFGGNSWAKRNLSELRCQLPRSSGRSKALQSMLARMAQPRSHSTTTYAHTGLQQHGSLSTC